MPRLQRKTLRIRNLYRVAIFPVAMVCLAFYGSLAWSQNVTIQQPVVEHFSVNTSVSVPDRGGIHLGGVHRAGSSRKSFGFSRPGTNTGTFSQGTNTSVHVWIHDFEEMDRAVLEAADRRTRLRGDASNRLRPNVAHAAHVMRQRHAEHRASGISKHASLSKR